MPFSFVSYISFVSKGLESQRTLVANWSQVYYCDAFPAQI